MSRADKAVSLFRTGCNCSQAILGAYAEELGLPVEVASRLAAGFGGGMGRMAGTCGAVTGAYMVLGLKFGPEETGDREKNEVLYARLRDFAARFEADHRSTCCRDLTQCDISTPEGLAAARERHVFATECPKFVKGAAELLDSMLDAAKPHE